MKTLFSFIFQSLHLSAKAGGHFADAKACKLPVCAKGSKRIIISQLFAFVRKSVSGNVTGYGLTVVMKGN